MGKITSKAIMDQIASFTTNRDKLMVQANTILRMIFMHAAPKEVGEDCNGTGDCTAATKLLAAMPTTWADGGRLWFEAVSPIRISSDGKSAGYDKKYTRIGDNPALSPEQKLEARLSWWKLEDANTHGFEDYTRTNGGNGLRVLGFDDITKMVAQLAKRITDIADDENPTTVVKPEDVLTAKAIAQTLAGLKFERVNATDKTVAATEQDNLTRHEDDDDAGVNPDNVVNGPAPARGRGRPRGSGNGQRAAA